MFCFQLKKKKFNAHNINIYTSNQFPMLSNNKKKQPQLVNEIVLIAVVFVIDISVLILIAS